MDGDFYYPGFIFLAVWGAGVTMAVPNTGGAEAELTLDASQQLTAHLQPGLRWL